MAKSSVQSGKKCRGCKQCDCNLLETMGINCSDVAKETPYLLSFNSECGTVLLPYTPPTIQNRMIMKVRITPNRIAPVPTWFLPGNFGATLGSLDAGNRFTIQILNVVTQGTAGYYKTPDIGAITYGTNLHQLFSVTDFHTTGNTTYSMSVQALNKPTAYFGSFLDPDDEYKTQQLFPVITGSTANAFHFGLTAQDSTNFLVAPYSRAQMLASPLDTVWIQPYYGAFGTFFSSEVQILVCGHNTVAAATTVPTVDPLDFLITIEN